MAIENPMADFATATLGDQEGVVIDLLGADGTKAQLFFSDNESMITFHGGISYAADVLDLMKECGFKAATEYTDALAEKHNITITDDDIEKFLEEPNGNS